jgi:hypothetical protein
MKLPPFLAAASLAALTSGCAATADTGDVSLALIGEASSGTAYRLRYAQIGLYGGATVMTFSTEDDPDRTSLDAHVPAGPYDLELLDNGWFLERLADDGTATMVDATLLSPNPQSLDVIAGGTTFASLRFRTQAEEVAIGEGDVVVTVDVDEVDAGPTGDGPGVSITSGPSGLVPYNAYVFEFTFGQGIPSCRLDGQPFELCWNGTFFVSELADGPHTVDIRVEGPGGVAEATRSFTVDATPPTVQLTSVPTGVPSPVTFTFVTGAGAVGTLCSIDFAPFVVCSSPWTTPPLAAGSHTVHVRAHDGVGNAAYADVPFTTL